jgi:hypothetical protein
VDIREELAVAEKPAVIGEEPVVAEEPAGIGTELHVAVADGPAVIRAEL